ncbi:MAG: phosphocholine cytidylyltransferase family protein [Bacteroidales bacterium]|jgi:choline kinase|nr:phosphocholine cytidylyltransferase family protein [Bacteroidales bacterium]
MNSANYNNDKRITTALLLAAGTGSRLYPLTQSAPKCLTLVSKRSILERLVINLKKQGFKRLVIVTGYKRECLMDFLGDRSGNLHIEYIHSSLYRTTNNIYSLWIARKIINEPFVLLESDLVFNDSLLNDMIYPDRIAVAKMHPWLEGTTVSLNKKQEVIEFHKGTSEAYSDLRYKTVNIYSFSLASWQAIIKTLNQRISAGIVNAYYESVFADMVDDKTLSFESVSFDHAPWYEIDNMHDLAEAEKIFPRDLKKQVLLVDK